MKMGDRFYYSKSIGWLKMFGTFGYTVFFFMRFPDSLWVLVTGPIIFVLDACYLWLLYNYKHPKLITAAS
jgi:hypothetical protein